MTTPNPSPKPFPPHRNQTSEVIQILRISHFIKYIRIGCEIALLNSTPISLSVHYILTLFSIELKLHKAIYLHLKHIHNYKEMFNTLQKFKDDLTIIGQGTMFHRMTQQHFLHNITKLNNHLQRKYK